jgi:hypothetical protein
MNQIEANESDVLLDKASELGKILNGLIASVKSAA